MNIVDEEFKLNATAYTSYNTEEYEMNEIRTDNLVITNDPVFRMSLKDTSTYTNLHKGYLQVQLKIVKADGSNYLVTDKITLANSIGCLFSRVQARLQNTIVETRDEQQLCSHLKNLVEYSQDYATSSGSNELYYKNTGAGLGADNAEFNDVASNVITRNANFNDGFAKLFDRTKTSGSVTAVIPLSHLLGIASVDRVMIGNTFDLELTRSNASEHLFRAGATDGKVEFEKMSLWLPRIRPTPELDLEMKSMMVGGVVSTYKFLDYNGYRSQPLTIGAGSTNQRIVTQSERPLHVFVSLRKGSKTQTDSPNLTRDELNEISLRLNGRTYPARVYDNLQTSEGKARAYLELLRAMDKSVDYSNGIQLSFEDFEKQSVYAFDLTSASDNFSKCSSTIEVFANLVASGSDEARYFSTIVVSERTVEVEYSGNQPTVSIQ